MLVLGLLRFIWATPTNYCLGMWWYGLYCRIVKWPLQCCVSYHTSFPFRLLPQPFLTSIWMAKANLHTTLHNLNTRYTKMFSSWAELYQSFETCLKLALFKGQSLIYSCVMAQRTQALKIYRANYSDGILKIHTVWIV